MKKRLFICLITVFVFDSKAVLAQIKQKEIIVQDQVWVSINSTVRLSDKWGFVADLHERRNNFLKDANFHFIRFGVDYWISNDITVVAGYAHLWLAPASPAWKNFANENRLYEQLQAFSKIGRVSVLQRLRNEQRWQEKIANDKPTGEQKFTDRVRYLLSFTVPVAKNPNIPSLVISDELCIQFGKEVVYNTFDQNKIFIGIKQQISKSLSFDFGYMRVLQQLSSGYQYNLNHTLRWFFYYNPDARKRQKTAGH